MRHHIRSSNKERMAVHKCRICNSVIWATPNTPQYCIAGHGLMEVRGNRPLTSLTPFFKPPKAPDELSKTSSERGFNTAEGLEKSKTHKENEQGNPGRFPRNAQNFPKEQRAVATGDSSNNTLLKTTTYTSTKEPAKNPTIPHSKFKSKQDSISSSLEETMRQDPSLDFLFEDSLGRESQDLRDHKEIRKRRKEEWEARQEEHEKKMEEGRQRREERIVTEERRVEVLERELEDVRRAEAMRKVWLWMEKCQKEICAGYPPRLERVYESGPSSGTETLVEALGRL